MAGVTTKKTKLATKEASFQPEGAWEQFDIRVKPGDTAHFNNQVDYCVGTGRMGLALGKEYLEQLKLTQEEIGFKHIRGHGLFHDDMAIYQEYEGGVEYNFTYLDLVMDSYLELGIVPFIELGFMPKKLASGEQTIFYWKGNTTPPKDYEAWKKLVVATLSHLLERYGEQVKAWPVEVWNEPNLPGFWYKADRGEYCRLFEETFRAVKAFCPDFKVGGPAICADGDGSWMRGFLDFCKEKGLQPDFITRHHYNTHLPVREGHYGYAQLADENDAMDTLKLDREIIDSYPEFKGLDMHVTEFNTSYIPNCPLHDTNQNAAFLARQLSILGDVAQSYSYWTFGDIFEEGGVPHTPFHGGFGLVANGGIPKPTFWTFAFYKRLLGGQCVHKDDNCVIVKLPNGEYKGVAWNMPYERFGKHKELLIELPVGDSSVEDGALQGDAKVSGGDSTSVVGSDSSSVVGGASLSKPQTKCDRYVVIEERVDEDTCNPLKLWHDLGEPSSLSKEQLALLKAQARPQITSTTVNCSCGGEKVSNVTDAPETSAAGSYKGCTATVSFTLPLKENAVVYFQVKPAPLKPDRGYHYDYVVQEKTINPLTRMDYPDPDVIRVGDTYYMVSTTMHFMPGCEILRSYDLLHWEHASYVYDTLDSTPAQRLEGAEQIYGKGMWAATIRYHKGKFYIAFVANDTHKTYLYTSEKIEGPWEKHTIDGFYHDCSLLFDDDDKVYIAYGNKDIYITELNEDLTGPKEGGLHRLAVSDQGNPMLGYEGSHFYKINGKYYLFFIHSLRDRWMRAEACFVADSIDGEFRGGDVLVNDRGYMGSGVAQGGIVDTPSGKWFGILFQDSGAVGRIPVLVPVEFQDVQTSFILDYRSGCGSVDLAGGTEEMTDGTEEMTDGTVKLAEGVDITRENILVSFPVFGDQGRVPEFFYVEDNKPGYEYSPLVGSDDFKSLRPWWQYNHEPDLTSLSWDHKAGTYTIFNNKICDCLTQARNTLTMRMTYPGCAGEITLDGTALKEGDIAGLCVFGSCYGVIGLTRKDGRLYVVMATRDEEIEKATKDNATKDNATTDNVAIDNDVIDNAATNAFDKASLEPKKADKLQALVLAPSSKLRLRVEADFTQMKDLASFYYEDNGKWKQLGPDNKMAFRLDHFTGVRFGLCSYATKETGGSAVFSRFVYEN